MVQQIRRVLVLGSTGSIGTQSLDTIERLNGSGYSFVVEGLAAGRNTGLLGAQIERWNPRAVSVKESDDAEVLSESYPELSVGSGQEGLLALCAIDGIDIVVNALVGAIGLVPTLESLARGRTVALANKESLVIGGELVAEALASHEGNLLPIDSEHNAVLQCLRAGRLSEVRRLILTASGGPFLRSDVLELSQVSPAEALAHPNWSMGSRISIDSATMVNKGFEVIEAHFLFDLPYEKIDVVIHPKSVVHSLVEYCDGSIVAEMASADMRIPIQYALIYPDREDTALPRLDVGGLSSLEFEPVDFGRFPAFTTVIEAARQGGRSPAVVNAADEVFVERFLSGEIPFTGISRGLEAVLKSWKAQEGSGSEGIQGDEPEGVVKLERLLAADSWARDVARVLPL